LKRRLLLNYDAETTRRSGKDAKYAGTQVFTCSSM